MSIQLLKYAVCSHTHTHTHTRHLHTTTDVNMSAGSPYFLRSRMAAHYNKTQPITTTVSGLLLTTSNINQANVI